MNKNKLPAFTLMELTIAMLIAAVLLGLAFRVLGGFTTLFGQQQREKLKKYEQDLLPHRLRQDFFKADSILYGESELELYDSTGVVRYTFADTVVLRDQYALRTDTFRIRHEQPVIHYVQKGRTTTNKVSDMAWSIFMDEKFIPLYFSKPYAATELMGTGGERREL